MEPKSAPIWLQLHQMGSRWIKLASGWPLAGTKLAREGPSWFQNGESWCQNGPWIAQVGVKMAPGRRTIEILKLTIGTRISEIGNRKSEKLHTEVGNRSLGIENSEIGIWKSESWNRKIDIKFWIRKIENEFLKTKFGNRKLENRNRTSLGATRHSSSFGAHHSVVALILESLLRSRSWALRYSPLKRENVRIPSHRMSVVGPEAYDTLHWN